MHAWNMIVTPLKVEIFQSNEKGGKRPGYTRITILLVDFKSSKNPYSMDYFLPSYLNSLWITFNI